MVSVNEVATTGTIKTLQEKFMYELGSIYDALINYFSVAAPAHGAATQTKAYLLDLPEKMVLNPPFKRKRKN